MSTRAVKPLLLLAGLAAGAPALAQPCTPEFSTRFSPGTFDREPTSLASHDEGQGPRLYALGPFSRGGGLDNTGGIVGWDGSAWARLGAGTGASARAAASFDDGSGPALFADGYFGPHPSPPRIGRWRDGQWTAVPGSEGIGNVTVMRTLDDGGGSALYFADWTGFPRVSRVYRWDGTSLTMLGGAFGTPNIGVEIHALHVHDDGGGPSLYTGGDFMWINGTNQPSLFLARWNGTEWVQAIPFEFALGGVNSLLTIDPDGNGPALLVCGRGLQVAGSPVTGLGFWRNGVWTSIGGVYDCACMTTSSLGGAPAAWLSAKAVNNAESRLYRYSEGALVETSRLTIEATSIVEHNDGSGPALHMAGRFLDGTQHVTNGVAKWDGQSLSPVGTADLGNAFRRFIQALEVLPHPATGEPRLFTGHIGTTVAGRHGAVGVWDGHEWEVTASEFRYLANAQSIASLNEGGQDWIYASGSFSPWFPGFVRWDGSQWEDMSSGLEWGSAGVMLAHDDGSGPALYLGGMQIKAIGLDGSALLRMRAGVWSYVGAPITGGDVRAIAVFDGGNGSELYIGGSSLVIGGQQFKSVARWDGVQWNQMPIDIWRGGSVEDMVVYDDGGGEDLYIFGQSVVMQPVPSGVFRHALRWNGTAWSHITSAGGPPSSQVYAAAVLNDGSGPAIYVGSSHSNNNAILSRFDGQSWTALSHGDDWNGSINQLAVLDEGTPGSPRQALYIGGSFTVANGIPAGYITRYGCPPEPSCYANCDESTVEPVLNVDDFTCFINEFAAGHSLPPAQQLTAYANCDGSTVAPVLNVDDFTCFINAFSAGCP